MAVDDASWLVFTRLCPGEHGSSACQALLQALCYYQWTGHRFLWLMIDNGFCCRS